MTIRVRAKDGSIQTFPAETPEPTVRMAMLAYDNKDSWGGMAEQVAGAAGQRTEANIEATRLGALLVRTAAPVARRSPFPSLIDPTFMPGTPQNNRVAGAVGGALEGFVDAVGKGPSRSAQSRGDEYEAACLEQHRQDMVNCSIVMAAKGYRAWRACSGAAGQRLAECLKEGPDGINTPPYWRK